MLPNQLFPITTAAILAINQLVSQDVSLKELSSHEISLKNRYPAAFVSDIFQDNILLNLAYMRWLTASKEDINWDEVKKPFTYEFRLAPNKVFAFHDDVLPEYKDSLVKTTQAHFNAQEGFKTDGYLYGDGVCHLASLIYWVAKDAGLDAQAPTNHDFMAIPEIDKQYGVSIYSNPYFKGSNNQQNLYIKNNTEKDIVFRFDYSEDKLRLIILQDLR